jgi:hypothetical protein
VEAAQPPYGDGLERLEAEPALGDEPLEVVPECLARQVRVLSEVGREVRLEVARVLLLRKWPAGLVALSAGLTRRPLSQPPSSKITVEKTIAVGGTYDRGRPRQYGSVPTFGEKGPNPEHG